MSTQEKSTRADRRSIITWMLTASSTVPFLNTELTADKIVSYDPKRDKRRKDSWERSLNKVQLSLVAILTDIILPSDDEKPSGSDLQIPDFIDEWVSAPYGGHEKDRSVIIAGLKWVNKEARKRFKKGFPKLSITQQLAICNDISDPTSAKAFYESEVAFFLLLQKLTFGAYFTTEAGKQELGDNPMPTFELPAPKEAVVTATPKKTRGEKRERSPKRQPSAKPSSEKAPSFYERVQSQNRGHKRKG